MILVHDNNFKTKIDNNYNNIGNLIERFYKNIYLKFVEDLKTLCLKEDSYDNYNSISQLLNEYENKLSTFCDNHNITSQSKLKSTFYEEFPQFFFISLLEKYKENKLVIDNKKNYVGVKLNKDGSTSFETKDIDICIGIKVQFNINNITQTYTIPIVAIEVKTYTDATMLNEIQFSSLEIKRGNPNAKVYVIMLRNEIGKNKLVSAKGHGTIDEMFVLQKNNNFNPDAIKIFKEQIFEDILNFYSNEINDRENDFKLLNNI